MEYHAGSHEFEVRLVFGTIEQIETYLKKRGYSIFSWTRNPPRGSWKILEPMTRGNDIQDQRAQSQVRIWIFDEDI